jgi:hypothetical protein
MPVFAVIVGVGIGVRESIKEVSSAASLSEDISNPNTREIPPILGLGG